MRSRAYWLAAACLVVASAVGGATQSSRVLRVVDGDTLVLLDAGQRPRQIRLLGVDAPEILQPFGQQARTGLSAQVAGRQVTTRCWPGATGEACQVYVAGHDVGLQMISAGLAWWNEQDAGQLQEAERTAYAQAEFNAKIRRYGLWHSKNPMPPRQWRQHAADR